MYNVLIDTKNVILKHKEFRVKREIEKNWIGTAFVKMDILRIFQIKHVLSVYILVRHVQKSKAVQVNIVFKYVNL